MQLCVRHIHCEDNACLRNDTEEEILVTGGMPGVTMMLKPHLLSMGNTSVSEQAAKTVTSPAQTTPSRRILALSPGKSKNWLADRKGMYAHLHPKQIASHSLKAFLQAVQKFVEPRLVPDAAGNPPDLAHIISSIDWRAEGPQLVRKARLFLIKTLAQLSLQRALEHAAIVRWGERIGGKLLKSPDSSAARKALKFGRVNAAKALLWTGAVATILPYVTYVITDWALIMYEAWVERKAATNRQKQLKIKQGAAAAQTPLLKAVFPKLLESGQSNVTGWALGVVGGSMGTLVWPGTGTMIGQLVPELAIELMK